MQTKELNEKLSIKIEKLPHSEVELLGEIPTKEIEPYRKNAIKHLGEHVNLDGFRKGKVPESVLISKIGEIAILEEAAELYFKEVVPEIFKANEIRSVGRPEILITKLVPANPVGFKIKTAIFPEVKLPDYKVVSKKIAGEKTETFEVTEKEMADVILNIRKSRAPQKESDDKKEGEKVEIKEADLPVFDDAFVKTLGDFKDVSDFNEKIKINLIEEKKQKAKEKKRIEIGNALIKETEIDVPEILIKSELEKMWSQFEYDITRMGVTFEDYLGHIKKDKETLQKEWRADAEKNAKLEIILATISEKEKIVPDEKLVKQEIAHVMEHYEDADPERARIYIETLFTHEAVFAFLENQK